MNRGRLLAALVLAGAGVPGNAQAQQNIATGTATGSASASVIQPLAATALEDLSFGAITVGASGGTLRVPATGGSAVPGGSVRPLCGNAGQCQPHPARFAVNGEPGRTYSVTLPASLVALGQRHGTGLAVDDLGLVSRNRGASDGGQLDAAGEDGFAVGGTLQVPAGTPADHYRAQFSVTVTYD